VDLGSTATGWHSFMKRPRITTLEEVGQIASPPSLYKNIKLAGNPAKFDGYDRTPYLASMFHATNNKPAFGRLADLASG
jgi:hypothetical protein